MAPAARTKEQIMEQGHVRVNVSSAGGYPADAGVLSRLQLSPDFFFSGSLVDCAHVQAPSMRRWLSNQTRSA